MAKDTPQPATAEPAAAVPLPPVAKKIPHVTFLHGRRRQDDYAWMRVDKPREDSEVMAHLQAENAYAQAYMLDTAGLQDKLYAEMRSRIKEADRSVPYQVGEWLYYTRTEEGKQYDVYCRCKDSPGATEEILLDVNQLAAGHEFFDVGIVAISPNDRYLAYTVDTIGDTAYTLWVLDLGSGEFLLGDAKRVESVAWANDSLTIYYATQDETTRRSNQVWCHDIWRQTRECIFSEPNEAFSVAVRNGTSGRFIYLDIESHTTSLVGFLDADAPPSHFNFFTSMKQNIKMSVDDDGRHFYIRTNDGGARNYKLMRTRCAAWQAGPEAWQEILPHRSGVLLEGFELFTNHLVVFEKDGGLTKVRVQDLARGDAHYVEFPEPIYEVWANDDFGAEMASFHNVFGSAPQKLRLTYNSMVSPPTVFEYDLNARQLKTLKVKDVVGYDPALYRTDNNPLLFTTLLAVGGHHGPSGRFEGLRQTAFEYAFLLKQVQHAVQPAD